MYMTGVEIVSQCALEHSRVLRYDGKSSTQVKQANLRHIQAIDAV